MLRRICLIGILALALARCQTTSYSADCNNRTDSGTSRCQLSFDQLSGLWNRDVDVEHITEGAHTLPIVLCVTVKQGAVQVSYMDEQNRAVRRDVTPDSPLITSGVVRIDDLRAKVAFESLGETAQGVEATIEVGNRGH